MISVIIPAHNEADVLVRGLTAITHGAQLGELEVVVVCNGCSDDTAEIARSFGGVVRVIETPVPSKSHALNLGDRAATCFPRFYVDADVVLPWESIQAVSKTLNEGNRLAAAPRMAVDLRQRPWRVRAFYNVWTRLPYCTTGMIGAGVYALTVEGRRRFREFPEIIADDGFVRLQFRSEERTTVHTHTFIITPPKTLWGIVKIKTRSHFGNIELKAKYPELWSNEDAAHVSTLRSLSLSPAWWPSLAVYGCVRILTRLRSSWQYRFGNHAKWERDNTSRIAGESNLPDSADVNHAAPLWRTTNGKSLCRRPNQK